MHHKKKVLITGAGGFLGKNLVSSLRRSDVDIMEIDIDQKSKKLEDSVNKADVIFHLAGVNRPKDEKDFKTGNFDLSKQICLLLRKSGKRPLVIFTSSTQAALDNPYGISKKMAEDEFFLLQKECDVPVAVFRLPGVFGKWCRPNYNSVVATFCHNIAHGLPITISDREKELHLVYIDDVVRTFLEVMEGKTTANSDGFYHVEPLHKISLGKLAETIEDFRTIRETLHLPDFNEYLIRCLYATYLSYLPEKQFDYQLHQHIDQRGELAELLKSVHLGQIFVSRTRPGITRGNHYHDTKVEKFVVLDGEALIRFRHVFGEDIIEYPVSGTDFRVVDIPPGYTHSIENIGTTDLIVLFWAHEIFDPGNPDTYFLPVLEEGES